MKFASLALLTTAFAAAPFAASAQDVGTTIYGNDDAAIGTVETNDGTTVTVDTGTYKAPLPAGQLAEREGRWTVNATKAQIDGMMEQQLAAASQQRDAALVEGAAVMSADGQNAGLIHTVDTSRDVVILKRDDGIVTLKREHFAVDPNGALMALFPISELAANTTEVPEGAEISVADPVAPMTSEDGVS